MTDTVQDTQILSTPIVSTSETVTISKQEYHFLQVVADIMRRDYIAVHTDKDIICTATAQEWDKAIEDLDSLD